jgi:hypothetical protein
VSPAGHARLGEALLVALFVALPLSTAAQELTLALALLYGLTRPTRARLGHEPWGRAALAAAVVWILLAMMSGNLHEGLGHAWLLAPLVAIPAVLGDDDAARARVERIGLLAAGVAAAWGIGQRALGGVGTAGLSHHLSLAYALLVPLGVAMATRRWGTAAVLAAGVFATGSEGAVVALGVTATAALSRRPLPALAVGTATMLALLWLADANELHERAILWTGGLTIAGGGAVGPGAYAAASGPAYDTLSPGFWFPNHAHDSAIQLLAVLGPAGLVAMLGLALLALRHGAVGPAAGLAGVLVGALTQDVLGDLEVARAAWAWLALYGGTRAISGNPAAPLDTDPPC